MPGVKIALLAYTFSTNGIALDPDRTFGANVVRFNALRDADYDPDLVHHHIELARKRGADLIVSSHHWGVEFEYYPPARIVTRAHELLDAGIDIIVGHHPHILNPTEWHVTPDGRTTVCLYSLGNLTSWALLHPMQRLSEVAEVGGPCSQTGHLRLRPMDRAPAGPTSRIINATMTVIAVPVRYSLRMPLAQSMTPLS